MLAAPELVEAETVELGSEVEVALELQGRMFAERVVRSQEGAELETSHDGHPTKRQVRGRYPGSVGRGAGVS